MDSERRKIPWTNRYDQFRRFFELYVRSLTLVVEFGAEFAKKIKEEDEAESQASPTKLEEDNEDGNSEFQHAEDNSKRTIEYLVGDYNAAEFSEVRWKQLKPG